MSLGKLDRPESLSEMASRALREAIIDGRLKLGDQVSETKLSTMLGISKTPVREALQDLQREGLIKIDPRRGTSIFFLEDAEIDTICDFRILLETGAAQRIFSGDRGDAHRRLRDIVAEMDRVLSQGDVPVYRLLDADFHRVLIACSRNAYIAEAYDLIAAKIGALRRRAHDDRQVVENSFKVHAQLADLVGTGEFETFVATLERHIRNAGRDYRAWLRRSETAGDGDAFPAPPVDKTPE